MQYAIFLILSAATFHEYLPIILPIYNDVTNTSRFSYGKGNTNEYANSLDQPNCINYQKLSQSSHVILI